MPQLPAWLTPERRSAALSVFTALCIVTTSLLGLWGDSTIGDTAWMILGAGGVILLLLAAWGLRKPTHTKRAESLERQD